MAGFEYIFPSIRGIQGAREYYTSMCPLRLIPKIFLFDEEELNPELRAQRILNKARIPEMARYITGNPKDYVFSSLTASVDGNVQFEPIDHAGGARDLGHLRIPMDARFVINDGQHRRAAIEAALQENADLGDETISVVFFVDVGLTRSQQMFADLNRYAVRPTPSIGILYDHRDEQAHVARLMLYKVDAFKDLTETERTTISNRSIKLFTLSGIYQATKKLLTDNEETFDARVELAAKFWSEVAQMIPDWQRAKERKVSSAELRRDYVHSHGLALQALARAGNTLLREHPDTWKAKLKPLARLDWSRKNSELWEGRALSAGRLSKRNVNITLSGNLIKRTLGLPLSPDEQQVEDDFRRNHVGDVKGKRRPA